MTARGLLARVLLERRRVLLPLGIAALVNLGVYVLVVYPLSLKVAASERRATVARMQLAAAERDEKTTRASLSRAKQADADLRRFYRESLPGSIEGARRMSYAKLASLADHHGLVVERRSYDRDSGYHGRLHKLKINMALSGETGTSARSSTRSRSHPSSSSSNTCPSTRAQRRGAAVAGRRVGDVLRRSAGWRVTRAANSESSQDCWSSCWWCSSTTGTAIR